MGEHKSKVRSCRKRYLVTHWCLIEKKTRCCGASSTKRKCRHFETHSSLPEHRQGQVIHIESCCAWQHHCKVRLSSLSSFDSSLNSDSAQSHDLRNALAGRIARAAAVFCVDEIIIFNDGQFKAHQPRNAYQGRLRDFESDEGYTGVSDPDNFLFHVLSYLECPPYLRQKLFPLHPNLRTAGSSHSLDMPHHLKAEEWCQYREGVTTEDSGAETSMVDVGFGNPIKIDAPVPPYTRVTLKFDSIDAPSSFPFRPHAPSSSIPPAEAVDPAEPREEAGYYWGYTVRQASSLSAVFTEAPFEEGYDVSIGTSERGVPLSQLLFKQKSEEDANARSLPDRFKHALIVFGGVAGLEAAAAADSDLADKGITKSNVGDLFDFWVDACPGQGSRTIRTEEAVWVTLSQLHSWNQSSNH